MNGDQVDRTMVWVFDQAPETLEDKLRPPPATTSTSSSTSSSSYRAPSLHGYMEDDDPDEFTRAMHGFNGRSSSFHPTAPGGSLNLQRSVSSCSGLPADKRLTYRIAKVGFSTFQLHSTASLF
jgi:hypothetical protein